MDNIPQPDAVPQAVSIKEHLEAEQAEQEPSVHETARIIATTLGETEQVAQQQIQRIVWALGRTVARRLLEQTLQIEENGGIMLRDKSRRRTPGGIFFHLAYTTGQPKEGRTLEKPINNFPNKPFELKWPWIFSSKNYWGRSLMYKKLKKEDEQVQQPKQPKQT
jgi:hypothetical protein